jgi:NAD(P)H-flavin reductase
MSAASALSGKVPPPSKRSLYGECIANREINPEIYRLEFSWAGPAPRAGQFFLVKPERTGVFLGRPLSAAGWTPPKVPGEPGVLRFLAARRGRGTLELGGMRPGEKAEISGPLGNSWAAAGISQEAGTSGGALALVAGGIGIAPLAFYAGELEGREFDLYAGFRSASFVPEGIKPRSLIITSEDGSEGLRGQILDFFSPSGYRMVCACGPEAMLKATASVCADEGVPCLVSTERRMACGTGACLGCTVETRKGNSRCCADGPVFNAQELRFGE